MDKDRFQDLADAYGGDLGRWPHSERGAAQDFATRHPDEAEAILDAARALDAVLQDAGIPEPDAALFSKIVESAPIQPSRAGLPPWAAMAAAVTLAFGVGAGWVAAPGVDEAAATEAIFADAFGALGNDTFGLSEEDA